MKFNLSDLTKAVCIGFLSLSLVALLAPAARADDAASTDGAQTNCVHESPEPGWYLMMAAGALVPLGFFVSRRKTASES